MERRVRHVDARLCLRLPVGPGVERDAGLGDAHQPRPKHVPDFSRGGAHENRGLNWPTLVNQHPQHVESLRKTSPVTPSNAPRASSLDRLPVGESGKTSPVTRRTRLEPRASSGRRVCGRPRPSPRRTRLKPRASSGRRVCGRPRPSLRRTRLEPRPSSDRRRQRDRGRHPGDFPQCRDGLQNLRRLRHLRNPFRLSQAARPST